MDWSAVVLYAVGGLIALVFIMVVGAELDLSTPLSRWRNAAIASAIAVVAGGFESTFSSWDLIPAVVVLATVIDVSIRWLIDRKRRNVTPP